jgi:RimJ/RimL family protein N-acetyltransferase
MANAPALLRPGAPSDAPALIRLFDEAVTWLVTRGRSDQWGSQAWSEREGARRMVDRFAASPGLVVAVEEVEGREAVVGALVVEDHPTSYVPPAGEPERFVHLLITSRQAAGRGIGTVLLDHARQVCRLAGVDLLRLDCFGGGDRELVRWYERQGFAATQSLDVEGWPCQVLEQRVAVPGLPRRFDELRTRRLLLRPWRPADREPYARLCADPVVMRHFPAVQDRATSDAQVDRFAAQVDQHGWGQWALERLDTGDFIGFTGLNPVPDDLPAAGGVEVGWRLARPHWGQGFAPEAAAAALDIAFGTPPEGLGLAEVVSFTSETNAASRRVMEKLGLHHDATRDFDHPRTPGWSGRRHVLYAIPASNWRARR